MGENIHAIKENAETAFKTSKEVRLSIKTEKISLYEC
jgi:hypothetical protein